MSLLARERSFYALVEQFRFVFRRRADYRPLHDADSAVFNPELKPD